MGEAKRCKEALRNRMLREIEESLKPRSSLELEILNFILSQKFATIERLPREQISWMRMKPNECHQNAAWYAENDPNNQVRAVRGWWRQGHVYVCHSVIEKNGVMGCLTPLPFGHQGNLEFAEDRNITIEEKDGRNEVLWKGQKAPIRVTCDPERLRETCLSMKERLLEGEDPIRVANDSKFD